MTFTDYDGAVCPLDHVSECVTAQIEAADGGDPSPVMDDAVSTARFLMQAIKRIRELEGAVELLRKLEPWQSDPFGYCEFCNSTKCGVSNGAKHRERYDCDSRNLAMKLTSEVR